jgi:hypothetical protein
MPKLLCFMTTEEHRGRRASGASGASRATSTMESTWDDRETAIASDEQSEARPLPFRGMARRAIGEQAVGCFS